MRYAKFGVGLMAFALMWGGYCAPAFADFTAMWTQKQYVANPPAGPGARGWVNLPYDSATHRLVLIGGSGEHYYNDIWHYDVVSDSWTEIEPYVPCEAINGFTPPTPRDEHAVVFDSHNSLFWMFGGSGFGCKGDLRNAGAGTTSQQIVDSTLTATEIDFYKNWTVSVQQPPYLNANVVQYDPVTHTLTLDPAINGMAVGVPYQLHPQGGGGMWSYSTAEQAWTGYDAPKWDYVGPTPPGRLSAALAYSSLDRALVMFGGEGNGAIRNDTWVWNVVERIWQQVRGLNDPASPPARAQMNNAMVYDSHNDVFILFGGRCYVAGSCPLGDTWAYKLATNTWTQMNPPVSPLPREQPQMAYDSDNHVVVMYGGRGAGGIFDDLWVYDYQANLWHQVETNSVSRPGPRKTGTLGYDPANKLFMLYGGDGGSSSYDIWTLSLAQNGASNQQPAVSLTAPANGSTYSEPANIRLAAIASDGDGSIDRVEFFGGATLLSADNSAPFSFDWSNVPAGVYLLTAKAYDNIGASTVSLPISITVNAVAGGEVLWVDDATPSGAILAGSNEGWNWISTNPFPFSGSSAHQSALVTGIHQHYFYNTPVANRINIDVGESLFTYVYLDPENPPSEVMLQWNDGSEDGDGGWGHRAYWGADSIEWGVNGTNSRRYMGALPPVGQWVRLDVPASLVGLEGRSLNGMAFTLYNGRATWDRAGKTGTGGVNLPPSISLTSPVSNASYTEPANIILEATASDTDGSISRVEFYSGAELINIDPSAPYTYTFSNVPAGGYAFSAKAYDNNGAVTTSNSVSVTVNAPSQPPQLTLSDSLASGLVTPATTVVTLNGAPLSVSNGVFNFGLPLTPGTSVYNIQATNPTGTAIKRITITVE